MPDNQKNLDIKITTLATGEGAKQTADELSKVTEHSTEAAKSTEKLADATGEHEKKLLGVNVEMGESRRLLQGLTDAFGPLVEIGRAFLNPLTGGLSLALGLFAEAKEKLAEWNKELDETADRLAEHYGNMAEAIADANRKIGASADETTIKLKALADQQGNLKEETDQAIESINRRAAAQRELNSAMEAYNVALGADPTRAKLATEKQNNQVSDRADSSIITAKQGELDNKALDAHRLQEIFAKLTADAALRDAKLDTKNGLPAQSEGYEKEKTQIEQDIKKQQAAVDTAQAATDRLKSSGFGNKDDLAASQAQADAQKSKLAGLEGDKKRLDAAIEVNKKETERFQLEQKNYEAAKTALQEIKTIIHDLTIEIANLRGAATENAANRKNIATIHAATAGVGSPLSDDDMRNAEAGASAIEHGGRATASQAALINKLVSMLNRVGETNQQALQSIAAAHNNTDGMLALYKKIHLELAAQNGQIRQLQSQSSNTRSTFGVGN